MQWEDKCFNVDSFQGNEAEYIIISLVRTEKIGFLSNNRRANVLVGLGIRRSISTDIPL